MQMWTNIPKNGKFNSISNTTCRKPSAGYRRKPLTEKFTKEMLTSHKEEYGINLHGKKYLPIVWTVC